MDKPAYCKMADAVASGTLDSAKTEGEWRDLCPGSQVGSSGTILPACDACPRSGEPPRNEEDRCATCWDWEHDVEKVEVLGEPRCANPLECADRVVRRYLDQGEQWDFQDSVERAKPKRKAKEGRCEYSGAKTRGAPFSPGGDLLLKKVLLELASGGDIQAEAELAYRGWVKSSDAKVLDLLADPNKADLWMGRRLHARWQGITALATKNPAAIRDIIASKTPKEDPGPPTPEQWAKLDAAPEPKKRGAKKR